MKKFTVAGVQMATLADDFEGTIEKAVAMMKMARHDHGANLVVYPESVTTGFNPEMTARELYHTVDVIPGAMTEKIQETARELGVAVLWPTYERGEKEGIVYNSAALFDEQGELAGLYRKTHPFPTERLEGGGWTTPGNCAVVCDLSFARVGIIICYDGDFPELSRVEALKGAEIILRPSAFLRSFEIWEITNAARAYDNHVYVVAVNAVGQDRSGTYYYGHSMIVSPIARKLALARGGEEIISATLDPEPLKYVTYGTHSPMVFDHLQDRNVKAYEGIMEQGKSPFEPSKRIPYSR
jgi:beta-ureidopropionase